MPLMVWIQHYRNFDLEDHHVSVWENCFQNLKSRTALYLDLQLVSHSWPTTSWRSRDFLSQTKSLRLSTGEPILCLKTFQWKAHQKFSNLNRRPKGDYTNLWLRTKMLTSKFFKVFRNLELMWLMVYNSWLVTHGMNVVDTNAWMLKLLDIQERLDTFRYTGTFEYSNI